MAQEQLAAAAARSIQGRSAAPPATSSGSAGQTQSGKATGAHGKSLVLPNGHSMPDNVKVSGSWQSLVQQCISTWIKPRIVHAPW